VIGIGMIPGLFTRTFGLAMWTATNRENYSRKTTRYPERCDRWGMACNRTLLAAGTHDRTASCLASSFKNRITYTVSKLPIAA